MSEERPPGFIPGITGSIMENLQLERHFNHERRLRSLERHRVALWCVLAVALAAGGC